MPRKVIAVFVFLGAGRAEAAIIGVSIPVGSLNDLSRPVLDGVWSVTAPPYPLNVDLGIGYLINPNAPAVLLVVEEFAMHEHDFAGQPPIMIAPHTPDPTRAVVTYTFDSPTAVDQLEFTQHQNGITKVEGFVGDSLGSLSSIGSIFGPSGDVTGSSVFAEGQSYVFDFDNNVQGKIFQFVIRKISLPTGYATYRAHPRTADGMRIEAAQVPEPSAFAILGVLGIGMGVCRRSRRERT